MGFSTWRERLVEQYDASEEDYIANTRGYWSTAYLSGVVEAAVTPTEAGVVPGALRFPTQAVTLFSYGVEDDVPCGKLQGATVPIPDIEATESDTNVSARKSTNGAEDFCFEGMSVARKGLRFVFLPEQFADGASLAWLDGVPTGTNLQNAGGVVHDASAAGALTGSLEAGFHQEDAVYPYLWPDLTFNAQWNRKRLELIGTGAHLAQGGGASWLRSHGLGTTDNRLSIPEGYIWRRDGQTDSDLGVVARLESDVSVIYSLPAVLLSEDPDVFGLVRPYYVLAGFQVRLHGISFDYPSGN